MAVGYRQGVSIAVLIYYVPALAIAIFLSIRHGFRRASGWRFMIVFTLARVLGSCLELATISQPRNYSLYIGYATLINIALSPLELVAYGLMSRVITSINRSKNTIVTPRHMRLAELLITVGLILSIVGGVNAGTDFSKTGVYKTQTLSKVGLALLIAAFGILCAITAVLSQSIRHAEEGEKRILFAVAASLPFLLVRLIYSILAVFAKEKSFSLYNGNVTILLCVALLEEAVIVAIYEGVGLTLKKVSKEEVAGGERGSWVHLMRKSQRDPKIHGDRDYENV
ncbi:hypothetical protein G7Y79_00062g093330 [Physcia stellaris]|nr:hypothetical protein G7Y79_00062g093330 [Physcia stellaris]